VRIVKKRSRISCHVDLSREFHRALHVGEQDGDLLQFALEGGLRMQNLVREVTRGVVSG
jgi:hypothetical protein